MEEKTYPIYTFRAKWVADGVHIPDCLPEGRIHDTTSFSIMYKEVQDIEQLKKWMSEKWMLKYFDSKQDTIKNPTDVELSVAFKRNDTWCEGWFSHWTIDDGRTDEEYLRSFEEYVRKKELEPDKYCLMGAEDRWRWKADVGLPCRCQYCKEKGIVRIDH